MQAAAIQIPEWHHRNDEESHFSGNVKYGHLLRWGHVRQQDILSEGSAGKARQIDFISAKYSIGRRGMCVGTWYRVGTQNVAQEME